MTDATLTTTQTETKAEVITYNWKDFFNGGIASSEYTMGIEKKSLASEMLTPEGLNHSTSNKKTGHSFNIHYDVNYVLETFSRQLASLGIIKNGVIDKDGMSWLLNELVQYSEGYAQRSSAVSLSALEREAKRLAGMMPGKTWEEWLGVLQSASAPAPAPTPETEKSPVTGGQEDPVKGGRKLKA